MSESNRLIKFDISAREDLLSGINVLANAVKITMGPRGKNVVIERPGKLPLLTKDGVTVAKFVNLKDQFLNLGVQMIKEAASRTAEVAGDGTTTATVLSQAIFAEGIKMLAAGFQISDIKRGIEFASREIIGNLKDLSIPISNDGEIEQVGTISANGESEIGKLLVRAISAVGKDGVITVEEAKGFETSLTVVEGLRFEKGYLSPYFITNHDKMTAEIENPYVLLCNKKITSLKDLMPILEAVLNSQRGILIIADDLDGDAMQGCVVNKLRGSLSICAVKSPAFGENRVAMMEDLAALLGTQVFSHASGEKLSEIKLEELGSCKRVAIGKTTTTLIGCAGSKDDIVYRAQGIREQLKDKSLSSDERENLKIRLSKLAGGVAILKVGGATEVELKERKDRVDDALSATQAAIEEGILPGGGIALVRASSSLSIPDDESQGFEAGIKIVKSACLSPLKQIVKNAGGTPDVVLENVKNSEKNNGYNAYDDTYGDMLEMGIVDPLKVVRTALENGVSAAAMMLTVGCAMVEDETNLKINDLETGVMI